MFTLLLVLLFFLRIIFLPLTIKQMKMSQKINKYILPDVRKFQASESIKRQYNAKKLGFWGAIIKTGEDISNSFQGKSALSQIYARHGVKFSSSIRLTIAQITIMVPTFIAIRDMCLFPPFDEVFKLEPNYIFYVSSLTIPDPNFLFPIISGLTTGLTLYTQSIITGQSRGFIYDAMICFVSTSLIIVSSFLPLGIAIYWSSTGVCMILINLIFSIERVKIWLKFPSIEFARKSVDLASGLPRKIQIAPPDPNVLKKKNFIKIK